MAIGVTKVNGSTQSFGATGRRLAVTKFAKTNMTQTELTAVVAFIQLTSSVIAIGGEESGATAFVSGTTDNVHILSEGPAPVAGADFGGVTGVTASVISLFDQR